jgi:hypothetical protein
MRRLGLAAVAVAVLVVGIAGAAGAGDKPADTAKLIAMRLEPSKFEKDLAKAGVTSLGGKFSKKQITKFRCSSSGDAAISVDMSCNTTQYGQDWAPDNEIAIAVDPTDPQHLLAGSNDYFYRFNNSTGARQALVPTGFFTSFDGGKNWIDGQIPLGSGNGAGDPAPAFDAKHGVALMAQLENVGTQGCCVSQGNVSVSRSTDGGRHWARPVLVMKGHGTGIGPSTNAVFFDKEWITVDNNEGSPHYGRAYVTSSRFLNGPHGSYAESPIYLSHSNNGGKTWSTPKEISGSSPLCTYQETGGGTDCDEDQFSYPVVASDGTLYVHFLNEQNDAAWEIPYDFDEQIMVVKSTDGGATFTDPVAAAQLEDGYSDMPWSVIGSQTVWGHQIRWASAGTIAVDPTNPDHLTVVWNDRGTANPNATEGCYYSAPGDPPNYDPCNAGPTSETNIYYSESTDGGQTWSGRNLLDGTSGNGWFPWADYKPDGTLVVAWDQDNAAAPTDTFNHVLKVGNTAPQKLLPNTAEGRTSTENPDVSVTHWAGQYVPQPAWPAICGPAGYSDPPVTDAEGKDCNVFDGDYTGLAVGSDGSINVVWTGLNRMATSPQIDFYTGEKHDGYAQDAMFARR